VATYLDGTPIQEVTDAGAWAALKTAVLLCRDRWHYLWQTLYNWYAVMGITVAGDITLCTNSSRKQLAQAAGTFLVMRNGRH
jgi:hypothetical protein